MRERGAVDQKEDRREKARAEQARRVDVLGKMRVAFRVDDELAIAAAISELGVFGPDFKMDSGDEPLLCSAIRMGSLRGVQALLEAGASVEAADARGWRAMHWAAEEGREDIVAELLARGASVNAKNSDDGKTPLMIATRAGHEFCVLLLLKCGADLNARDFADRSARIYAGGKSAAIFLLLSRKEASPTWIKSGGLADAMMERIALRHAAPAPSKSAKGPRI